MKKTLLSVIAGLAVIGSATAVPSMDVQQKNCEDGQHVWVEKTKTCVPINPCLSNDENIKKAYCLAEDMADLPHDKGKRDLMINTYIGNVSNTGVSAITEIDSEYVGVKTQDGNYLVFKLSKYADDHCLSQMIRGFHVYGYGWDKLEFEDRADINIGYSANVNSETECNNIINFASAMAGKDFNGKYESGKCVLVCIDKTF